MFRPKLELHVQFYELAYSNVIIMCLKEKFDLFFLSSSERLLSLVPLFSLLQNIFISWYIYSASASPQQQFLFKNNNSLSSLDMFCFVPTYEVHQHVLKVNSSISGILLDPFWSKVPKYIRRAQIYLDSAKFFE